MTVPPADLSPRPGGDLSPRQPGYARRGMRVLGVALRGAPGPFALGIAGAVLTAAATALAAWVLGWATDEVLLPTFASGVLATEQLLVAAAAVVGVALLKAAGVVARRLGAYVAQYALQSDARRAVTRRYLDLPLAWHRRHPTGQLLSNASADVEAAFFVAAPLPMAIGATALLAITGVLLVVTDAWLAIVGFCIIPLLLLANWRYQRRMRGAARVAQQARAEVADVAHESFDGALVVKTLGREEAETERFAASSQALRDRMIVVGRLRASFDPLIEALPSVGVLLVLLVGAVRVRDGALSAGSLVQFAYLFRLVAVPLRVFGWLLGDLPRAVVGLDRVERVLAATGSMRHGTATGAGEGGAALGTHDVGFRHPPPVRADLDTDDDPAAGAVAADVSASRGVADVTFDVAPGKVVALVGPTGAGKSTLAALLVRLYDPDHGEITLDGTPLPQLARDQLAARVALVPQEAFLFDDTVRGNITLGMDLDDAQVREAARLARADGFIAQLPDGYDTPVGERGTTLSGGQRQRIALARALVRRPRLLVLDDATSAVDPSVESEILRGLADAALPSTIVVVAYRRATIELADEVVVLADGRVVACGRHEQLVEDVEVYRELLTAYDRATPLRHDADDAQARR